MSAPAVDRVVASGRGNGINNWTVCRAGWHGGLERDSIEVSSMGRAEWSVMVLDPLVMLTLLPGTGGSFDVIAPRTPRGIRS